MAKRKPIGAGIGEGLGEGLAESVGDYIKLPGKAERYKNKRTGKTISRRQYENIRAREAGWESWSEYQREARKDDWMRWRGIAAHKQGKKPTQLGMQSDFAKRYTKVKRARQRDSSILYDPEGPLAEFLVYLGLRQPDNEWMVGDTP